MSIFSRLPLIRDILQLKQELNTCQDKLMNMQEENIRLSEELQVKFDSLKEYNNQSEAEWKIQIEKLNDALRESQQEQRCKLIQWNKDNEERWNKSAIENKKLIETVNSINVTNNKKIEELSTKLDASVAVLKSNEYFDQCNLKATQRPIVWGNQERLHISSKSAVFTCFFNVNSGEITVGDFSFAGSGVSILAGSHDMFLPGFLRRDAEITEGCDIKIGSGVWLGSNSTILGPAIIEDNAVIAAGAVVVPGTVVEANCVYGGVPAKKIKELKLIDCFTNIRNIHVQNALQRNNGVLCVQGWRDKEPILIGEKSYVAHKMNEEEAVVLTSKKGVRIYANNKTDDEKILYIKISKSIEYSAESEDTFSKHVLKSGATFIEVESEADVLENQWIILRSDLANIEIFIADSFEAYF